MSLKNFKKNHSANEGIDKYKLLSAYGGPGSLLHTQYGTVIISCIEEWGFLKTIKDLHKEAVEDLANVSEDEVRNYVQKQARLSRNGEIDISNDFRFIEKFKERKGLAELKYFVLIPDLELNEYYNTIKGGYSNLSIPSTFMPKMFSNFKDKYDSYYNWYIKWEGEKADFFPPKEKFGEEDYQIQKLKQDNIVLICGHGHISDFPWAKFLRWKVENPIHFNHKEMDLYSFSDCCDEPNIAITSSSSNSSGFDGKWLKCKKCNKSSSLKGLFNISIICPGHKPWEVKTGSPNSHYGDNNARRHLPPTDECSEKMKVALTTGNNIYYSRIMSSIYMPNELFKTEQEKELEIVEEEIKRFTHLIQEEEDQELLLIYERKIKEAIEKKEALEKEEDKLELTENEKENFFRFQEFDAFLNKTIEEININKSHLKVYDCTFNLGGNDHLKDMFSKVLRIDNMKITSAQLDFSRVHPFDSDQSESSSIKAKNIFRKRTNEVLTYPVVENFGEGIFFAFNNDFIHNYLISHEDLINSWISKLPLIQKDDFSESAVKKAKEENWLLYLIHTFSHLIMRELEFRCGYPTASLKERIYVSNDNRFKMHGCLIYTAEGSEGSMGGLIAQTKEDNLISLIKSALKRATICNSDPLCWDSNGQGLYNLNYAGCFSCALVSETSCELRNIYLDRKLLVDEKNGFFKNIIY